MLEVAYYNIIMSISTNGTILVGSGIEGGQCLKGTRGMFLTPFLLMLAILNRLIDLNRFAGYYFVVHLKVQKLAPILREKAARDRKKQKNKS